MKVILVSLMAFAVSVLVSWAVTAIGIPWPAPVSHDGPTFFPVRWIARLPVGRPWASWRISSTACALDRDRSSALATTFRRVTRAPQR